MAVGDTEQAKVHGPKIAIANKDDGVTGFGLVGNPGFISQALEKFGSVFGKGATLKDIASNVKPGTTATSPDDPAKG